MDEGSIARRVPRLWLPVAYLAATGVVLWAVLAGQAGVPISETSGIPHRVVRVFSAPWEAECEEDSCGLPSLFRMRFRTPSSTEAVQLTASATLSFQSEPGTVGKVGLSLTRVGDGRRIKLRPREYPISSPSRTSTTLVWFRDGVAAGGATYVLRGGITIPFPADGGTRRISGDKITVVVEMLPT